MTKTKLINDPASVVAESLAGLVAASPGLALIEGSTIVLRADIEAFHGSGKVALISGGGSGHEPAHAGYVGRGILTAAVAGGVFASPSTDQVLDALRTVTGEAGALLIVKNYTGDRLNFGLAAEIARAEGLDVELVVVDDDAALGEGQTGTGRRGIAGTVLIHKIAGAMAESGADLTTVKQAVDAAIADLATMGVALSPCTLPGADGPNFELGDGEIELGLGIHGETGAERVSAMPAKAIVDRMLSTLARDRGITRGERVALLVNNLGATTPMETALVAGEALSWCREAGLTVERVWQGAYLTALDMAGVSLSLMRLSDGRLDLLDAAADAPAWRAGALPNTAARVPAPPQGEETDESDEKGSASPVFIQAIEAAARSLIEAEPELTRMDRITGDGDIGQSLTAGATAILDQLDRLAGKNEAEALRFIAATVRRAVGGTSGPLYAALALGAARDLGSRDVVDNDSIAQAFSAGVSALVTLGGAQPGDRTMVDALAPAAEAMMDTSGDAAHRFEAAARAARAGAEATAAMAPRLGRSSYIGERVKGEKDPGAEAVAIWLDAVAQSVQKSASQ